jgi:fumarylacetoacetate (FAA) hydrolase family protein
MKLCRFTAASSPDVRVGLIAIGRTVLDLTDAGVRRMIDILERRDLVDELTRLGASGLAEHRRFNELVGYLFRSQRFPNAAVLLTGAGVVPPDEFTLAAQDTVRITISGVGTLENPVAVV